MSSDKMLVWMEDNEEGLFDKFKTKKLLELVRKKDINKTTSVLELFELFCYEEYEKYEADYGDYLYDQYKDSMMEEE